MSDMDKKKDKDEEEDEDQQKKEGTDDFLEDDEEPAEKKEQEMDIDTKLTPKDFEILREQVRAAKGLPLTRVHKKHIMLGELSKPVAVKNNSAYQQRYKATQQFLHKPGLPELLDILRDKADKAAEDEEAEIKNNVTSDYRNKISKGGMIVSEYMRKSFSKFGKPPYKPYALPRTGCNKSIP